MASRVLCLAALCLVPLGVAAGAMPAIAQEAAPTIAQRAALLARDTQSVTALRDVRRLHIAYTQFAEVGLWDEMADLFAPDAEMIVGDRTMRGKAAIRQWIVRELGGGRAGLAPGEVRTLLPATPVASLGPDGTSAKIRWHELAMLGSQGGNARWTGGIYENDYVKRDGVWLIARMHYYPQFDGSYEEGWRNVEADLKVVPYHYTPRSAGIPIPELATPAPLEDAAGTVAALDAPLTQMIAENAVRNLQNAYGYYVDRRMWDDVSDLFETDGTLDIAGLGAWNGQASIRRGLERQGPAGIGAGELNEHVQVAMIVTVDPDGMQARARGLELAMTGRNDDKGYWAVSIFENVYRKRDGIWRIAAMNLHPRFRADYEQGWAKSRLDPVPPAAAQAPDAPSAAPKGSLPAFSYMHPVTGKRIDLSGAVSRAMATAGAEQAPAASESASLATRLFEGERKVRLLQADIGAENVSNAFGNYIDDFEWKLLGDLFARKGAREMPYAGFYIGPDRITEAEIAKWGQRRSPRRSIPIHLRIQPVMNIAPDGRSARFRTRLFSIGSSYERASTFSGGVYPNDQAVLEDGVWKLWSVAIDEFYYRSSSYAKGWTGVEAEPAEMKPNMLITAYPPDIALTELGQRQQGYIPGSRMFNPYVFNGPAYPGYPSATPMWFSYVNPVSGRVPPHYWPDCVTCATHPDTRLDRNGY
ncbi:nuclear transport factor 2 family protein [Sphingobium sp. SYK-6]|uniref:nuclear transport factor 2 family protein n=1 Tax=Sphingobium sp. (strain NBRC 103272 / SYK-6) TaxID=627192 RepID=UPI00131434C7|nr:nuclear transport factor 2 family protein [Sphingobium sp. SYK-6]